MANPKTFARQLVRLSLDEQGVVSAERVSAILEALREDKPREYRKVLSLFEHGIETELRKSLGTIEHAGTIDEAQIKKLQEQFSQERGKPITFTAKENKDLIAGIRIHIGDDVYDYSVQGQLQKFATRK